MVKNVVSRLNARRFVIASVLVAMTALCALGYAQSKPYGARESKSAIRDFTLKGETSNDSLRRDDKSNKSTSAEYDELLAKNSQGVQTRYPAIVKVVGRCSMKESEDGLQKIPFFYGSGVYVAEYENWGIVVTNWHVVSESDVSIDVCFPSGSEPARVILRDRKWDFAALVVKKPQGITPMPLALAVPKVGETLWTAGYGPSSGLNDFKIQAGTLTNYVSLDVPLEDLPKEAREQYEAKWGNIAKKPRAPLYETASIKIGVRKGDSGGPVLNRYGEVAGMLWGSDGECTMSTSSVRMQVFVTQAIRYAARLRANKEIDSRVTGESIDDVLPWDVDQNYPDAFMTDLPMTDAVRYEGVFPASTTPIYAPGNGVDSARALFDLEQEAAIKHVQIVANDYWKERKNGLPPSPPIFSPTFVVQQRQVKSERPELINEKSFANLNAATMATVQKERALINSNREMLIADNSDMQARLTPSSMVSRSMEEPAMLAKNDHVIESFSKGLNAAKEPPVADVAPIDPPNKPETQDDRQTAPPPTPLKLSKLQTYGVVCALFCLFYFAVRTMRPVERRELEN